MVVMKRLPERVVGILFVLAIVAWLGSLAWKNIATTDHMIDRAVDQALLDAVLEAVRESE